MITYKSKPRWIWRYAKTSIQVFFPFNISLSLIALRRILHRSWELWLSSSWSVDPLSVASPAWKVDQESLILNCECLSRSRSSFVWHQPDVVSLPILSSFFRSPGSLSQLTTFRPACLQPHPVSRPPRRSLTSSSLSLVLQISILPSAVFVFLRPQRIGRTQHPSRVLRV
jgi:hypothetical protein